MSASPLPIPAVPAWRVDQPPAQPGDTTADRDAWAAAVSRGIARGSAEDLEVFYRAWFGRAYAAARRATGRDEAFCLDVVQDAMVKAARRLRPVSREAELAAWFERVVRSCALDRLRAESRRARLEAAASRAEVHDGVDDALAERIAWLEAELSEAAEVDRRLLRTRYAAGGTLDHAGAAAGLSGPAAHGRLRRLIDRLRSAAKARFGDE